MAPVAAAGYLEPQAVEAFADPGTERTLSPTTERSFIFLLGAVLAGVAPLLCRRNNGRGREAVCHSSEPPQSGLRGTHTGLLVLSLLASCGCAFDRPLPPVEAARLIQNSDSFAEPETIAIDQFSPGSCSLATTANEYWRRLNELSLINLRDTGSPAGPRCEAVLTSAAKQEVGSGAIPGAQPGRFGPATSEAGNLPGKWTIPVANKVFLKVTAIRRTASRSAEVDFAWQWEPTSVGRQLGVESRTRNATAALWLSDSGWRIDSMTTGS